MTSRRKSSCRQCCRPLPTCRTKRRGHLRINLVPWFHQKMRRRSMAGGRVAWQLHRLLGCLMPINRQNGDANPDATPKYWPPISYPERWLRQLDTIWFDGYFDQDRQFSRIVSLWHGLSSIRSQPAATSWQPRQARCSRIYSSSGIDSLLRASWSLRCFVEQGA